MIERDAHGVDGNYLQTVGRAQQVLCLFHHASSLTLSEVCALLKMSTTVAFRLLYTLTADGFLKQDAQSKRYSLGGKILMLGYAAMRNVDIKSLARPYLVALSEKTEQTVELMLHVDDCMLCIDRVIPESGESLMLRKDVLHALHKSTPGMAVLAQLSDARQQAYFVESGESRDKIEAMKIELSTIKRRVFSYNPGATAGNAYLVAFPLFDGEDKPVGALCVSGPYFLETEEMLDRFISESRQAAEQISAMLGSIRKYPKQS